MEMKGAHADALAANGEKGGVGGGRARERKRLQGYLAHKKDPFPSDQLRSLGTLLL